MKAAVLILVLLNSAGAFAAAGPNDRFIATENLAGITATKHFALTAPRGAKEAKVTASATLRSGRITFTVTDGNGNVRGQATSNSTLRFESDPLDPSAGPWSLEVTYERATGSYEVGWTTLPAGARSQSAAPTTAQPVMAATGAFFALSVADVDASARWYSEKLGLKEVMREPKRDKTAVVVLDGGGLIVELIQNDDAVPFSKAAPGVKGNLFVHGVFKAGVVVADFDRTLEMLKERGVEIAFGPYPARGSQRANVIVKDNAGNLIQFFGT